MKKVIISALFLILILFLDIFALGFCKKLEKNMTDLLIDAKEEYMSKNYNEALHILSEADEKWRENSAILVVLIDHGEIYLVEDSIIRLKIYCNEDSSTDFLSEIDVLLNKVHDLSNSQKLAHENIF